MGPSGEGNWFPPQALAPPKCGVSPVLGGESYLSCYFISCSVIPSFFSPSIQTSPTIPPQASAPQKCDVSLVLGGE